MIPDKLAKIRQGLQCACEHLSAVLIMVEKEVPCQGEEIETLIKNSSSSAERAVQLPSAIFDTVVATCVFCSVPDPVQGLREVGRVVRPDGHVLLLEHICIDKPVIGPLMDFLAPLVVRINGASINRRTIETLGKPVSGLTTCSI